MHEFEGAHVVIWCSLLCGGNEATGELTIEEEDGEIAIPICEECLNKIKEAGGAPIDKSDEGVVE